MLKREEYIEEIKEIKGSSFDAFLCMFFEYIDVYFHLDPNKKHIKKELYQHFSSYLMYIRNEKIFLLALQKATYVIEDLDVIESYLEKLDLYFVEFYEYHVRLLSTYDSNLPERPLRIPIYNALYTYEEINRLQEQCHGNVCFEKEKRKIKKCLSKNILIEETKYCRKNNYSLFFA